ncbi:MAG: PEP-CTERM sorting domain-containing protein [Planctomycetota bacterium]|jgi:hypothetical protein
MLRKIVFLSLLVTAVLSQSASATPTDFLPESSYATAIGKWQGYRTFDRLSSDGILGKIEFAVYDSHNLQNSEETTLVNDLTSQLGLDGQYIYAYQVFNLQGSQAAITSVAVGLDLTGTDVDDAGASNDDNGGIAPDGSPTDGVWEFNGRNILVNEHSWFLVFSSNQGPVVGDYKVEVIEHEDTDLPIPEEVPEPGTLMLLGFGGTMLIAKRKRRKAGLN